MRCCGRLTSGRSVQISATRCCQRCSSHGPGQHRSAPGRRRGSSCPSHTAAGTACSARQRHRCGGSPSRCAPRRKTCTAPAPARQQAPSATIVPWRSHAHMSPQPHARASLLIATRQYIVVTHTPWRRSSPARLPSAMRLGGCGTKRTPQRAAARLQTRAAPSRVTATRDAQSCAQGPARMQLAGLRARRQGGCPPPPRPPPPPCPPPCPHPRRARPPAGAPARAPPAAPVGHPPHRSHARTPGH